MQCYEDGQSTLFVYNPSHFWISAHNSINRIAISSKSGLIYVVFYMIITNWNIFN